MYQMPYYSEKDTATIIQFMQDHPFAMLTGCANHQPVATQIPLKVTEEGGQIVLYGHMMKKTDHHDAFVANPNAMVLFTGAHCYVSSSWYTHKGEGATWNYMTVQARGTIELLNEEETITILQEITDKYEASQPNPQLMKDIPKTYIQQHVKAIAGFRIVVKELNATFKLSQNRDEESYDNIIQHLERIGNYGELEIAKKMKERKSKLFQ